MIIYQHKLLVLGYEERAIGFAMTPAPNEPSKSDMDNSESTDGGATGTEGMRKRAGAEASSEAASNTNGSEGGAHDHGHSHGHDHGSGAKKRKKPW